jgi:hypothetical protein
VQEVTEQAPSGKRVASRLDPMVIKRLLERQGGDVDHKAGKSDLGNQVGLNRREELRGRGPPIRRPRIHAHAGTSHDQAEHGDPPERRRHCRVPHGRTLRSSQKTDEREMPWTGHDRSGSYSARLGSASPENTKDNERMPRLGDLPKDIGYKESGKPDYHP